MLEIASNANSQMVTAEYADQQAEVVYDFYSLYITGDPNALKLLLF
jgi:hypothetical protein